MPFEQYLSKLIEFTESRQLVMSRQSEAWSHYCQQASVEYCAKTLLTLGVDRSRAREWPEF